MICEAIQEFFAIGRMYKQWNSTRMILIPKAQSPASPNEFRPISYCNVVYKRISKLLCTRLKEVLPSLVANNQGAFVRGRELLYNVLLCQEIARGYTRKHISPRCMMKVDLKKSYDSVHWDAVKEILISLSFPNIFLKWLMEYIITPTYIIHMNREDFGFFEGGRGLRQGDPLSPLIFALVMEYLSRVYLHATNPPPLQGK